MKYAAIIRNNLQSLSLKNSLQAFLVLIVGLFCFAGLRRGYIYDELECLRSAWFIGKGMIPYVDFFQHHHPLFYYILSPFSFLLQPDLYFLVARFISLGAFFTTFFFTYKVAKLFADETTGLISAGIFFSWNVLVDSGFEVRPDTPQIAFSIVAIYSFYVFLKNKKHNYLAMSAICASIAFLFLQKSFLILFFMGIILLYECIQKRISAVSVVVWIIVYSLPIIAYWAYLIFSGNFYQYWVCNYFFNALLAQNFSYYNFLKMCVCDIFLPNTMLWFFFFIGFIRKDFTYNHFLVITFVACITLMRINGPHYWIVLLPFISFFIAQGLREIFDNHGKIVVAVMCFLFFPNFKHLIGNIVFGNTQQLSDLSLLRSFSEEDDFCFGDDVICNLRKGPGYFWHGDFWGDKAIYDQLLSNHKEDDSLKLLQKKPVVVQESKLQLTEEIKNFLNCYYVKSENFRSVYLLKKSVG